MKMNRWEKSVFQGSVPAYLRGTAEMIVIDLFYRLEVDHTLQLGLMFVCGEGGKKNSLFRRQTCWQWQIVLFIYLGAKAAKARHITVTVTKNTDRENMRYGY